MSRPVLVTDMDLERLTRLLHTRVGLAYRRESTLLRQKLKRARIVPAEAIPRDVVTMNSRVVLLPPDGIGAHELQVVYPWSLNAPNTASVLASLGLALLGHTPGDDVRDDETWAPLGRIFSVPYQPEAAGDMHL
ncbi:Regulator of nucleoside diphosphate kinase [Labilithrix luteola]|uniref:Regulator of nucleoside diphosphate kinase n=1 Tax=Labilithrix luteola TaxID=1391654 RepID=A0A0K1QCH9_9BACT|nr:GreA/GreB family elongation factor [Labilithrix luteola]AKV03362.1 Regulator of nucleoside diphosphate kinase [Labilithrix luteola]